MKKLKNNFKGLINSFSSTIDIRRNIIQFIQNHYSDDDDICNILGLNYNRYSNINEDRNGNFNINVIDFEKYLLGLL